MSAIFISHASADSETARDCRHRLYKRGHRSIFLDVDSLQGIRAGSEWERVIYTRIRSCQAVVVLCSAASTASTWCFAEVAFARALGKRIFPVRIEACALPAILDSVQFIDIQSDIEAGYERLCRGLLEAGLDPADSFDWDGSRPPYPGMAPLLRADAPVFFGRETAVHDVLATWPRDYRPDADSCNTPPR